MNEAGPSRLQPGFLKDRILPKLDSSAAVHSRGLGDRRLKSGGTRPTAAFRRGGRVRALRRDRGQERGLA